MANRTRSIIDHVAVANHARTFGADPDYIPAFVRKNGKLVPALFTNGQLTVAIQRAEKNKEDAPVMTWWQRVFG